MKRDIFRRGMRMQHQFGSLEQINDPLGVRTFDPKFNQARQVSHLSRPGATPPLEVQQYGERFYAPERSAVVKPNGRHASLNGPEPDYAELLGRPISIGTKRRLGPIKTDK